MDQRFRNLAIVRAQLAALEADLSAGEPEALSWVERRLANHLVWADTMAEDLERQFSRGEEVDTARFAALLSVIVRLAQLVGTKRRAKPVPRLEDLLADHKRQSAA